MGNKQTYLVFQGGLWVALLVLCALNSCSAEYLVAEVNDHKLSRSDAELVMKNLGYDLKNKEDWQNFIDTWVNAMIMKDELSSEDPNKAILSELRSELFDGELSEYYLTENRLMKTVDTIVSDEIMRKYYDEHLDEFSLNDFIVKALYLKVPLEAEVIEKVKSAFLLKNDKDLAKIESYAKFYAEDYYFDDLNWIFFDKLKQRIPLPLNKENLVLNRTKTYLIDDKFIYFINIIDFKLKDETPPLEFVKENIQERVLASRLNAKRKEVEQNLTKQLRNKHDIKINL